MELMQDLSKFITLREAARLTGYHQDYLSYCIRTGRLVGQKVGKTWVTTEEELKRCFEQSDSPPPDNALRFSTVATIFIQVALVGFFLGCILTVLLAR
jgi:hypothetical protein